MSTLVVGCGRKPKPGAVNLDWVPLPGVDVVHNLEVYPYPFDNETFDRIEAEDVLEHLDDMVTAVNELGRILKTGGVLWIQGPHYNRPDIIWADPTHRRAFAPRTFDNFDPDTFDGREYGHYFGPIKFRVVERNELEKVFQFTLVKR